MAIVTIIAINYCTASKKVIQGVAKPISLIIEAAKRIIL